MQSFDLITKGGQKLQKASITDIILIFVSYFVCTVNRKPLKSIAIPTKRMRKNGRDGDGDGDGARVSASETKDQAEGKR